MGRRLFRLGNMSLRAALTAGPISVPTSPANDCYGNPRRRTAPGRLYASSSVRFPLAPGNDQHPVPDCGRCTANDDPQR